MPPVESASCSKLSIALQNRPPEKLESVSNTRERQLKKETVVEVDLLPHVEEHRRMLLEWNEISCFVPNIILKENYVENLSRTVQHMMESFEPEEEKHKQKTAHKKQILHSLNGYARAGEILAMMGPSGSGKTTLLSVLGGRAPKLMTTEGKVTFNGVELNKTIRRSIGYVFQDDLLYENLTVYETLYYAALLKLPKTMSRAEKIERVEAVISALGLSKCRETLIGGGFRRGVSGGERKRVSVGHELLTNPSVLILDEPTSGLDSTTAMRLISSLKSLADGGRTVVTTIHQPSSRLFRKLTNVMLLRDGQLLYYGCSHLIQNWFEQKGFPVPDGIHVADFILDVANCNVEGDQLDGETVRVYLVEEMIEYLANNPHGFTESNPSHDIGTKDTDLVTGASNHALLPEAKQAEKWGASFLEQVKILSLRAARNRRFSSLSYQDMFHATGIVALVIPFWWQTGDGDTLVTATNVSSLLFFLSLYVQYGVIFRSLFTFPNVFKLMVKERSSGMYRLSAFYLAESCCDIPLQYLIPTLCIIVVYWGVHLRQSFLALVTSIFIFVLTGLNIQTFGLLIGAAIKNSESSLVVATLVMVGMMLGTGFWVKNVPSSMRWFQFMTPSYWGYRTLLQIQFQGKVYFDCGGISEAQLPMDQCTPIDDLGDELGVAVSMDGEKWSAILILIVMLFTLRVITYYVLKIKTAY